MNMSDGTVTGNDGSSGGEHSANEVNRLWLINKQLKLDLQAEQDVSIQLRKRLNAAEKQKLEAAAQSNEKVASLETQLAKVRSQIEKGEAARQSLEYELVKSQKEVSQIKQASKNKEDILIEGTDDLKCKIGDLSEEVKRLQKSLQSCKENAHEQQDKLKESLEEKIQLMSKYRTELDSVFLERDKLHELCQQHSRVITELNGKLQEFEDEKRDVLDSLRHATAELEHAKIREDRMKADLQASLSRIKTLEENIDAERASHLESKFNSEIVLMRVKDLESAVDVGKSGSVEANKAIERLVQQNKELEQVCDEERRSKKEQNKKLDKLEKEYMTVKLQLSAEMEDKQAIIGNLSKQLELHQKNFNDLKSELSKAKKQQQHLEHTYGGSFKELELLLQTFRFDDKKLRMSRREDVSDTSKGKKVTNPAVVVENLKHLLVQQKKKIDSQVEEISKTKKTVERLTKELDSSKELVKARDKTIEDTQKNCAKATQDLNKMRSNYSELEATLGKLKTNLELNADTQNKDRTRIQDLSEEIMKLVKKHRSEEEEQLAFLHGLHQKLLSSHITVPNMGRALGHVAWSDLSQVVYEQVSVLVELLQSSDEKLKTSYEAVHDKQSTIAALKHEHAEQITRLTNTIREREATWQQQNEDMEQHYKKMLNDLQSQTEKTQAMANQAWKKVRTTGSVQQSLESEVVELRRSLAESQVHTTSLLSACALLSGALYPLYVRTLILTSEIHILKEHYMAWENCRERALYLISVLMSGKDSDQDKPEKDRKLHRKMRPILGFRVGVITVLAANRLLNFGHKSAKCFVAYAKSVGNRGLSIDVGGLDLKLRRFKGAGSVEDDDDSFMSAEPHLNLRSWLSSAALLEAVVASMTKLHRFVCHNNESSNPGEVRALVSTAQSSFSQFIDQLSHFFPSSTSYVHISLKDHSSVLHRLGKRLSKILSNTPIPLKGSLVSSQELMSSLQNHLLDLTQRLHTAEKERRHLRKELNELKQQIGDESSSTQGEKEKNFEESKKSKYIPVLKFEQVCIELSNALRREQKAQKLLQEQSDQLMELTSRLDFCASDGMQKQTDMLQLQESLTEAQSELRHKEQSVRQLNIQLGQVQYERDSLLSNLSDAENALKNSARDKEILAQYMRNVEGALQAAKKQFSVLHTPWIISGDLSLPRLLLDADHIPQDIGHAGPELIALQNLVGSFIDTQHQAESKVRALQEEVSSHREHIDTLKMELSNAVHRKFIEQIEDATDGVITSLSDMTSDKKETYIPLKEDTEEGSPKSQLNTLISPPIYQSKTSAFQSVKPPSNQTPKKSK